MSTLADQFGAIDVYLFDQLLKGRIERHHRILDAGCGGGRNLIYFLREGYDWRAVDADERMVETVRVLARSLAPALGPDRVFCAPVEDLPFEDGAFDVVIANAVLHFAADDAQFEAMVRELLRVLTPGGFSSRVSPRTSASRRRSSHSVPGGSDSRTAQTATS